jgi:adenine-specific DNA-methyltransferase
MNLLIENDLIEWKKNGNDWIPYEKIFYNEDDEKTIKFRSIIYELAETGHGTKTLTSIFGAKDLFENPKPVELIKELLSHSKNDLVLDFYAGSGTTAQAVMELNLEDGGSRKCILVTNNEVSKKLPNGIALDITRERIFRIINGKGSNGERFSWKYSDEKPTLSNNSLRVFEIKNHELKFNDFQKAKKLIPVAELQFKKLNPKYKPKNNLDLYNDLAALNPYKKD